MIERKRFTEESRRKDAEGCRQVVENTSKLHLSAEQMMERCRQNQAAARKEMGITPESYD